MILTREMAARWVPGGSSVAVTRPPSTRSLTRDPAPMVSMCMSLARLSIALAMM